MMPAYLALLAETTNAISGVVIVSCLLLVTLLILRLQQGEGGGSSSVVRVHHQPVQVAVQKLFVPFTLKLHNSSTITECKGDDSLGSINVWCGARCDAAGASDADTGGCEVLWWWAVHRHALVQLLHSSWPCFEQAVWGNDALPGYPTLRKTVPEGEHLLELGSHESVDLGPPPRTVYPLVVVQIQPRNGTHNLSQVGSVITVLHVPDTAYPEPARVMYQYLKQRNGQLTLVTALYTQNNGLNHGPPAAAADRPASTSTGVTQHQHTSVSRKNKQPLPDGCNEDASTLGSLEDVNSFDFSSAEISEQHKQKKSTSRKKQHPAPDSCNEDVSSGSSLKEVTSFFLSEKISEEPDTLDEQSMFLDRDNAVGSCTGGGDWDRAVNEESASELKNLSPFDCSNDIECTVPSVVDAANQTQIDLITKLCSISRHSDNDGVSTAQTSDVIVSERVAKESSLSDSCLSLRNVSADISKNVNNISRELSEDYSAQSKSEEQKNSINLSDEHITSSSSEGLCFTNVEINHNGEVKSRTDNTNRGPVNNNIIKAGDSVPTSNFGDESCHKQKLSFQTCDSEDESSCQKETIVQTSNSEYESGRIVKTSVQTSNSEEASCRTQENKDSDPASEACCSVEEIVEQEVDDTDDARRPTSGSAESDVEVLGAAAVNGACPGDAAWQGDGMEAPITDDLQQSPDECVVCQTNRVTLALLPCRHVCVCETCFDQLMNTQQTCPLCRTHVAAYFIV